MVCKSHGKEGAFGGNQDFFEDGPEAMKPLILADIAQEVDLHESTISRVTNRKYLVSPRGLFELKYFFSSRVGT